MVVPNALTRIIQAAAFRLEKATTLRSAWNGNRTLEAGGQSQAEATRLIDQVNRVEKQALLLLGALRSIYAALGALSPQLDECGKFGEGIFVWPLPPNLDLLPALTAARHLRIG